MNPPDHPVLARVLKNTGVLLGGRAANAAISLGYTAIAARSLGVREVGILILINAFAQMVGDVVKFNSWQTVLHYGAGPLNQDDRPQLQQVIRFAIFLDIVGSLAGVLVAGLGAFLFGARLGWPAADNLHAALYAFAFLALTPATPLGLLRLFDRFDLITAQTPLSSLVRLAGGGIVVLVGASLTGFLVVWAAGTAAAFVYICVSALIELRRRGLLTGWLATRGPLSLNMPGAWRFAWATNFSATLDTAFTHAITLAVGALAGPGPAAFWRIGRQVADGLAKPSRLLIPSLYPELARLHVTEGHRAMRRLALQVGLVGGGIGTALLAVAVFAGGPLLTLVMGKSFAAAAPLMAWQVAAAVIGIWGLPLEPMLVSIGRPGDALKVRIVVSAGLLASLPFTIEAYGVIGAAGSLVGAMLALVAGMFAMVQRKAPPERFVPPKEMACMDLQE